MLYQILIFKPAVVCMYGMIHITVFGRMGAILGKNDVISTS